MFALMRGDHARGVEGIPSSSTRSRGTRSAHVPRVRRVPRGLGDRRKRRDRPWARGHAPRRRSLREQNVLVSRRASQDRAGRGRRPVRAIPTARSRSSTKRWRHATASAIARSKRNCIGRAAKSCSSAIPADPRRAEDAYLTAIAIAKQQGSAQLRTARGARARQALPIDRPPRRSPRGPRARARRLFADAGNAGDRRGAGAARGAGGDGRGQGASRAAAATDAAAGRLRQRAHRGARLRRAGNDGSLRQSPRVGVRRQRRARAIGGRLWPLGRQLRARRLAVDEGACGGLPQPTSRRDPIRPRPASRIASPGPPTVRWRVSRGAGSLGTGARLVRTRPRRRSGLSFRTGRRRRRDALSGDRFVASRRGRSRGFSR